MTKPRRLTPRQAEHRARVHASPEWAAKQERVRAAHRTKVHASPEWAAKKAAAAARRAAGIPPKPKRPLIADPPRGGPSTNRGDYSAPSGGRGGYSGPPKGRGAHVGTLGGDRPSGGKGQMFGGKGKGGRGIASAMRGSTDDKYQGRPS